MRSIVIAAALAAIVAGCAGTQQALKQASDAVDQGVAAVDKAADAADRVVDAAGRVAGKADLAVAKVEEAKAKVEAVPDRVSAALRGDMNHTVVKGDTLWDIDRAHGGDGFGWYGIYRRNRDQITDYDLIEPGWALEWNRREAHSYENRNRAYDEPAKGR